MRSFQHAALCLLAVLALFFPAAIAAAELPTDPERLVIETQNGPVAFSVELAMTPSARATGLMNRQSMPADHGMLFGFERAREVMMWMKNTPLPLDMIFIRADGTIARIAENTVPFSETIIPSVAPVRYVLELNGGTAEKQGIAVGDKVRHRVVGN